MNNQTITVARHQALEFDRLNSDEKQITYDLSIMPMSARVELLTRLIDVHDLTFEFSDDHRYWVSGQKSLSLIRRVAITVPRHRYVSAWNDKIHRELKEWAWPQFEMEE
jgi:hypothetical protein